MGSNRQRCGNSALPTASMARLASARPGPAPTRTRERLASRVCPTAPRSRATASAPSTVTWPARHAARPPQRGAAAARGAVAHTASPVFSRRTGLHLASARGLDVRQGVARPRRHVQQGRPGPRSQVRLRHRRAFQPPRARGRPRRERSNRGPTRLPLPACPSPPEDDAARRASSPPTLAGFPSRPLPRRHCCAVLPPLSQLGDASGLPGPGSYDDKGTLGSQRSSRLTTQPAFGFGSSNREVTPPPLPTARPHLSWRTPLQASRAAR